jgi:hypothetical protein
MLRRENRSPNWHGICPYLRMNWLSLGMVLGFSSGLSAAITIGPFTTNAVYTLIADGGFEGGTLSDWQGYEGFTGLGSRTISSNLSAQGRNSLALRPNLLGFQRQFGLTRNVTLVPETEYRLSALFYTAQAYGKLSLEVWAVSPHGYLLPRALAVLNARTNVAEWQFADQSFVTTRETTNLSLRLNYEGFAQLNETVFTDDIAITPATSFRLPVPTESEAAALEISVLAAVRLTGTKGRPYRLQYSDDSTNWLTLTNLHLPDSRLLIIDAASERTPKRLYRAESLPP